MRVLAISSAYAGADIALVDTGRILAEARTTEDRGLAGTLPGLVETVLDAGGRAIDLVAVTVGPGSFTGLRAGIAVASGIALALAVPVVGVTVAEALAESFADLNGRALWTAIAARRGRLFLDTGSGFAGVPSDSLPAAPRAVAVCGNAANEVAALLAARGVNVMLTAARRALPVHVVAVGMKRAAGQLAGLAPAPLYVDPPEAKLPAGGLRAAPA